jgi:hypothetical protein
MKQLEQLITELENSVPHYALSNPQVSKGSVGWHIEHSLLTLNVVFAALKQSNSTDYKATFDIRRLLVMALGKIPRGRVRAPKAVQPSTTFTLPSLQQHIMNTRVNLKSIESLSPDHFFKHPFLGDFKLKPAMKFLRVHTNHHLHIINDIIRNNK